MAVPLFDLKRQYKKISNELEPMVLDVLRSGWYIGGPVLEEFEQKFADYCGAEYGIGVASGTDALIISLRAAGITSGDEVIVPSFTFFASAEAVSDIGAIPVFADVDYDTMCITAKTIEPLITKKTKGIMPVHLFGHAAPMDEIIMIAERYNLIVIEDACQAVGTLHKGNKAGSIGTTGCFSFFPSKNLGAAGDGGIITTDMESIVKTAKKLRNHGSIQRYRNDMLGYNSRLDALQAATLIVKLKYLDEFNNNRRANSEIYSQLLGDIEQIALPIEKPEIYHTYHQYTIRVAGNKRDELDAFLNNKKIGHAIYYPVPVHALGPYVGFATVEDLPNTMRLAGEVISLPIFPELTDEEIAEVVGAIIEFFS